MNKREKSRRINVLKKVLAVQEVYKTHKRDGVSDAWIFRTHIQPVYFISERTFRTYIETNAQRELKQLNTQQHETHFSDTDAGTDAAGLLQNAERDG